MSPRKEGQSALMYLVLLAVILYVLISAAMAVATADKCGELDADKEWQFFPPGWECVR